MRRAGVLATLVALMLTGCGGGASEELPDPTDTASVEETETVPVEELTPETPTPGLDDGDLDQPLDAAVRHLEPRVTQRQESDLASFGLTGVFRVEPAIAIVVGVLTPGSQWRSDALTEAPFRVPGAADFSALSLRVAEDERVFVPLRTARGDCLCSSLRSVTGEGATAVHAVVPLPVDAAAVTLSVDGIGDFDEVPVRALPKDTSRSRLGSDYNIEVLEVTRGGGALTTTIRIENVAGTSSQLPRGTLDAAVIGTSGPCFRGLTVLGTDGRVAGVTTEVGCQRGYLPGPGRYVDLTLTLGDPGGRSLVFLPTLGEPITGVEWDGPLERSSRDVVEGQPRFRLGEIEVAHGGATHLRILSEALFVPTAFAASAPPVDDDGDDRPAGDATEEPDGSVTSSPTDAPPAEPEPLGPEFTAGAEAVLEDLQGLIVAETSRSLTFVVHAGGSGSASEKLARSRAQAELLTAALQDRLGPEWSVRGSGLGEAEPRVPRTAADGETDLEGFNSRVEITVGPA